MRRRPRDAIGGAGLGLVGWVGLILAALGWALLIGRTVLGAAGAPALAGTLRGDAGEIAHCLIGSGFALAVIGCLLNGFGALNRFFDTVLARSGAGGRAAPARPEPPAPVREPAHGPTHDGPIHDARPYRTFPDGSVEVETILGTRRFASMAQARDFI